MKKLLGLLVFLASPVLAQWVPLSDAWTRLDGGIPVPSGYLTIKDETTAQAQRSILTLLGAGVTCADSGANFATECTIPGGGGSTPTGTGFTHITAGAQDAAAKLVDTADVNPSQITYAKIQNSAAGLTLLGRAANSTGVFAEIAASAASDCVYRESASALGCGTIATAGIAANAVTLAKFATQAANTVLANVTAGSAVPTAAALPSCVDSAGNHLNYTNGTGFSCGTSSGAGGGVTLQGSTPGTPDTGNVNISGTLIVGTNETVTGNTTMTGTLVVNSASNPAVDVQNSTIRGNALTIFGGSSALSWTSKGAFYQPTDGTFNIKTNAGNINGTVFQMGELDVLNANGALVQYGTSTELLTLSTGGLTTDTTANLLPANSIIDAVTARITTTITTTTNWAVGDASVSDRFSSANATLTSGTTSVGLRAVNCGNTTCSATNGQAQVAAAKVRITCTGSNPGAGVIRLTVFYHTFVAPTS